MLHYGLKNILRLFSIALLLVIALFFVTRLAASGDLYYVMFADRDLWRAVDALQTFPHLGPEHSGDGQRIPGGIFYYFLWAWLQISTDVLFMNDVVIVMFGASAVLFFVLVHRYYDGHTPAIATALYVSTGFFAYVLILWNPGFLPLFVVAIYFLFLRIVVDGHAASFPLLALVLSLAMQFHSQIVLLVLILIGFIAVKRIPIGLNNVVLGVVLFLLPFAHYLYAEMASDWPNTALIAGRYQGGTGGSFATAVANVVLRLPDALGVGLAKLFSENATLFGPPFHEKYPAVWLILEISDTLVAAVVGGGALAFVLKRWSAPLAAFWRGERLFGAMLWIVALYCAAFALYGAPPVGKHLIAAVPPAALIFAAVVSRLFATLTRSATLDFKFALALSGMALVGVRVLVPVVLSLTVARPYQYDVYADIAAYLKSNFYPDRETFENRAFDVSPRLGGGVLQQDYGRISYFYRRAAAAKAPRAADHCTFVVRKPGSAAVAPRAGIDDILSLDYVKRLKPRVIGRSESRYSGYVHYVTENGNCLKSFSNSYIPNRIEREHEAAIRVLPVAQGAVRWSQSATPKTVLVRVFENRLPVILAFREDANGLGVSLHGRALRGPAGLSRHVGHYRIHRPRLLFTHRQTGKTTAVLIFDGMVGSLDRGTLAPWRSPRFVLPDGRYRVVFAGQGAKRSGAPVGEPFSIRLADDFRVPAATPSRP